MPSTYTLNNGIELIGTGEQSGTWGDTTNTNLELLDTALDGQVSITLAATGSSGSPNTLPISDGASSNGRNRLVIFGDGGDLGGTAFVQLTPNDAEKIIYVRNNLSGSRSILLFQGTYSASNDYEVPAGTTAVVFFNGAGTGAVAANVFNNAFFDSLRLGSVSVDKILDEDNMASDDAAALATQQSIKAYVDSQVGTVDTLAEILANGNTTGGTNIQMTTTDELQFRDTALKISSSADGQLDIDADTEIEIVAPTVDIDASTAMTIDTAALTVTGAVDLNTSLNVDGTVTSDGLTVAGNVSVDGGTIKLDGNYPTGSQNLGMGDTALDSLDAAAYYNVAFGPRALTTQTTGNSNTAVGQDALRYNQTSSNNSAFGTNALGSNTTGGANTGLGRAALQSNSTASGNTMAGYQAGYLVGDEIVATAIVSGVNYTIQTLGTTDFTLIGAGANTVGTTFTATGAGTGTGTASANANYNTFVGHQSGDVIVGGSKNSILGRFDGNQGSIDIRNSDNNIVLSDGDGNPRLAYVSANTELVINEQSADVDFRVESDSVANMFFVDASTNRIGINTNAPTTDVDIVGQGTTFADIKLRDAAGRVLEIKSPSDSSEATIATTTNHNLELHAGAGGATNYLTFKTDTVERLEISSGAVIFNDTGANTDFRVESDTKSHAFFVDGDGSNNRLKLGMGTGTITNPYSQDNFTDVNIDGVWGAVISFKLNGTEYGWIGQRNSGNGDMIVGASSGQSLFLASNGNTSRIELTDAGNVVVNPTGADSDFQVRSNTNTHALFVDGGASGGASVGIGNSAPAAWDTTFNGVLQIGNDGYGFLANYNKSAGNYQTILGTGFRYNGGYVSLHTDTGYTYLNSTNGQFTIYGGDATASVGDAITFYDRFKVSVTYAETVVNEDGRDFDFRVESDTNTHALFVDAGTSGVGIGNTANSNAHLNVDGNITGGYGSFIRMNNTGTNGCSGFIGCTDGNWSIGQEKLIIGRSAQGNAPASAYAEMIISGSEVVFNENSNDRDFRVESDSNSSLFYCEGSANGLVHVGKSAGNFAVAGLTMYPQGEINITSNDNRVPVYLNREHSGGSIIAFYRGSATFVGSITVTSSSTTYNTTSDRRLKTDIQPIANGTEKLMAMNPVSHKWIADPEADAVHGFIAQEMQDVVPEAVSGDPDGEEMMSMDYGRITPVLVAALQDAHNKITALEKRLAELEAN